uniref:Aspartyl/asparaginy/proline hydroxylase domain-containing protein n=1 Tax=Chrysotila carterae TaxID=13221 RepID=A0A7S4ERZ1_CHRCT
MWARVEKVLSQYCLSPLAMAASRKWVKQMADPSAEELSRLRAWMLMRVNGKERATPLSTWQLGCPEILSGLRAQPVWDSASLACLRPFEEQADAIRAELLALRSHRGFQPLKIPNWASRNKIAAPDGAGAVSHDAGDWNVFYLHLHEVQFPENCARCPITTGLLKSLPRSYQHAFFSALTPGTHIVKHHGPTNKKLRVHLPLIGASGAKLRVADETHELVEGKAFAFDDSFEHEAWHHGDATRIVLVFDLWHPDLSDREVQFFSFLQRSRMRAEMAAERASRVAAADAADGGKPAGLSDGDNFFKLLQDAKDLLPDNDWWV